MPYYFPATFIPELKISMPPEISVEAYQRLLKENLSSFDLKALAVMRSYFDLENIRYFWMGYPMTPYGNWDENALEEALLIGKGLPDYVYKFMDTYDNREERINHFGQLFASFFSEEIRKSTGFLKTFLIEERAIRLILVALRSKKWGKSLLNELQYENPDDHLVAWIIAQKDAKSFDPPEEYKELKTIYELYADQPLELSQALLNYRFKKIEELLGLQIFTIDRLLAYYFQLVLIDRWFRLDQEKGKEIIKNIVRIDE